MEQAILTKLELPEVFKRLKACCVSSLGEEMVTDLKPSSFWDQVRAWQGETTEAKAVLQRFPNLPLKGFGDIRNQVHRAFRGGVLDPAELILVKDTLKAARKLKEFSTNIPPGYPVLLQAFSLLHSFPSYEQVLETSITAEGEVADGASPVLGDIRRQGKILKERVRSRLEHYLHDASFKKYLQDSLVTIRSGRYVLPIRQEYRTQVPGIVHDQSASGATVFIEPMPVVELNNRLRMLLAAEDAEVQRVLRGLSATLASLGEALDDTIHALQVLDFIFAKGKLSLDMFAEAPRLNDRGYIFLRDARHPLLKGDVVPIDLFLGDKFQTLVVTGPNTGGKTVALKTLGLLTLMSQCGLHVPAAPETEIAVFEQVLVDIGDEQSIEQSLSTFSSHMRNIIAIISQAGEGSLILLDELGAGTDPGEGAALAMALLDYLADRGARTLATTHYGELKYYAHSTPGVENAAVEFDDLTLKPAYRIQIGVPGKSNALKIAERLGLNSTIINRARNYLSKDAIQLGDLLQDMEEQRVRAREDREKATEARRQAEEIKERLEKEWIDSENKKRSILEDARVEAEKVLHHARLKAEKAAGIVRKVVQEAQDQESLNVLREVRKELEKEEELVARIRDVPRTPSRARTGLLMKGCRVFLPRLGQNGVVLEVPGAAGDNATVQLGSLRLRVDPSELEVISVDSANTNSQRQVDQWSAAFSPVNKASEISPQVDLRGLTVAEALEQVEKYLDDAILAGLNRVTLIHGKGTGALRKAVMGYLMGNPRIKSSRPGGMGEGGLGVTVVELT